MKVFSHYTTSPNTTDVFDFPVIPVYKKEKRTFILPPKEDDVVLPVSLALEQSYWEPLYYFLEEQRKLLGQPANEKPEALRAFSDLPF